MARRVRWAERAAVDLGEAAEYIARDSPVYAASLVSQAHCASRSLSTLAERGRVVPEFNDPNRRELFVASYRLIYRIADEMVNQRDSPLVAWPRGRKVFGNLPSPQILNVPKSL